MTFIVWLIGIGITVFIAFIAPWISHSTKISEFRQAWINDLRKDIAEYASISEKWFRVYQEINPLTNSEIKEKREREEASPLSNEARIILYRIRMRFNPHNNPNKHEDDAFLESLNHLLDPGKWNPKNVYSSWQKLADSSVEKARHILKREWEETKKIPAHPLFLKVKGKIKA